MAPQWSPEEDRALLLSLVQVMASNGPSKHQFDAARVLLNDRWTLSAITQHYNKKLRPLAPATLGTANSVATPVRSATKRKAPASKTADPSASPTPGAEGGRRKKKATPKAASEEAAAARDEDDEDDDEQSSVKKAKVDDSDGQE